MISCDTNILFPACDSVSPQHQAACAFLQSHQKNPRFCISEQVLLELYVLLRNPTLCRHPLTAPKAVAMIQTFRSNPNWMIVDVQEPKSLMSWVWEKAGHAGMAYRRIFDLRLAATLHQHGVTEFATCNQKDFRNLGFQKVWNPL